eukprot:CAMPEP_0201549214 /NCGR_PEP_ID=MMETSP0173_2-20130828/5704_1 /ASSEMBLY_ACC=CAM_ASM_000268 /TAXON_ID=218659 /ORGANISM="Vexillifera sp., Strain DIVA3 564/2" /LENGTH=306 /DNA_ID=CAMNT_0047958815 /DNA_START=24 /DNA_END=944 /DNA_ORIENTATION=-
MALSQKLFFILFTLSLIFTISVQCSETETPSPKLDFRDFWTGNWQIEVSSEKYGENTESFPVTYELFFEQSTTSSALSGQMGEPSLDVADDLFSVRFSFPQATLAESGETLEESSNTAVGQFYASSLDLFFRQLDEPSPQTLEVEDVTEQDDDFFDSDSADLHHVSDADQLVFEFDFQPYLQGTFKSAGQWNRAGDATATYQLVVIAANRFILHVFTGDNVVSMIGHKVVSVPEKTFLQKYSMPLMIGVFMIVRMFLSGRQNAAPVPEGAQGGDNTTTQSTDGDNQITESEPNPTDTTQNSHDKND